MVFSHSSNAHLLNMTEAQLTVTEDRHVELLIQLDASRAFEDREHYFKASQLAYPLDDSNIQKLLESLLSSIELTVIDGNEIKSFADYTLWQTEQLVFLEKTKLAYFDLLNWPKIEVTARTKKALSGDSLYAKFKTEFIFEEPISLTLSSPTQEHSKTRWLIAHQQSPSISFKQDVSPLTKRLLALEQDSKQNLLFYFIQGVEHVLPFGYDHLLFVAALAFTFLGKKSISIMLSVFTLAHCMTLLISVYGIVRVPSSIVEPAIALSIAWAGFQLIRHRKFKTPPYSIIFLFGLLHGLGFAGALSELGLPSSGALLALLTFNIGIELGQMSVMLISTGFLFLYSRYIGEHGQVRINIGYGVLVIGFFWALLRVYLIFA